MSFANTIGAIFGREGGYVNDPADRGGETNFGITLGTARRNGFSGAMRNMTQEEAAGIYRRAYWDEAGLDSIAAADAATADALFDVAVNMGVGTAGRFLQRALNLLNRDQKLFPDLAVDGALGQATLAAMGKLAAADYPVLVRLICAYQGKRYIEIIEHDASQERFTRGWINRLRGA